jgi:hypothetical protein
MTRVISAVSAFLVASALAACAVDDVTPTDDSDDDSQPQQTASSDDSSPTPSPSSHDDGPWPSANCAPYGNDVYTPYLGKGPFPIGTVAAYPWRGPGAMYPDGDEDFRGYTAATNVECGGTRDKRGYLEVTAGCLDASDAHGVIHGTSDGYYRSFALAFAPDDPDRAVKWTDLGVEYRFYYGPGVGVVGNTGFKAFVRYRTEYDLYVASWRLDGVVQIQKKACGEYTVLQRDPDYGAPARGQWHTIRFEAVGDRLQLFLDGKLAMTQTDKTFASGTAGIRIDSMDGALIDDWRVFAP